MNLGNERAAGVARVLVADDHPLSRRGIVSLIANEADLALCGQASTIFETRRLAMELTPDLVILDLEMHGGDSFQLLEELRSSSVRPKIVALAGSSEHDGEAERALKLGAAAFVSRRADGEELLRVIRSALAGNIVLGDAVIERLVRQRPPLRRAAGPQRDGDGIPCAVGK